MHCQRPNFRVFRKGIFPNANALHDEMSYGQYPANILRLKCVETVPSESSTGSQNWETCALTKRSANVMNNEKWIVQKYVLSYKHIWLNILDKHMRPESSAFPSKHIDVKQNTVFGCRLSMYALQSLAHHAYLAPIW